MSGFGARTTADEVLEGLDLTGRRAFVTGGYSGLGKETARALAARGAQVTIAGRDADKLADAAADIESETGRAIGTCRVDLSSLASIRNCGEEARRTLDAIDILVNNAGVMATPLGHTEDGFEMQFGTNHLGHFLLTSELMPLVEQGDRPRIVNLSSRGHHITPVDLDDPNFERRAYNEWASYGQSKTANVLFTVGLEQRFAGKGIHAYAVHPGGIQTNLGRNLDEQQAADLLDRVTTSDPDFEWKTIPQGAATTCWAATAPELENTGGVYLEDCHVAEVDDASSKSGVRSYAVDPDAAERLWAISEDMVGTKFGG